MVPPEGTTFIAPLRPASISLSRLEVEISSPYRLIPGVSKDQLADLTSPFLPVVDEIASLLVRHYFGTPARQRSALWRERRVIWENGAEDPDRKGLIGNLALSD